MQQKKTKRLQKRRTICNQVASKCHYQRGSCYNEEDIHFGKAKCTSRFYKLSRSNAKCGSMWVLVAFRTNWQSWSITFILTFPHLPLSIMPILQRAFYNKIVGCLWLFLWAWVMCNLSSYEGIQFFYEVIDAKCVLFAKKFNDLWIFWAFAMVKIWGAWDFF